jgi:gamma-glutamyltranspeptidase/glutathione hydrolase
MRRPDDQSAFTTRPTLAGTFGMVASTHWLASAAGWAMLESGGTAADAAVATGFALQVVEPHNNSAGGEVPILLCQAGGEPVVLAGQGPAPAAASAAAYRDRGLELVPGIGQLAAVVPGAMDAWLLLLRDRGTKSLREVLEPAIGYAERGFPALPVICDTVRFYERLFTSDWTSSAELYLPVPKPGDLLRNSPLAATYRRLVDEAEAGGGSRETVIERARDVWYRGFVAEAIVAFSETPVMDTTGQRNTGLLTEADLASWSTPVEEPTTLEYGGVTVCKTGPWGQGPVFLQQLALLDALGVAELDDRSAEFVHVVSEAAKLAFADREAWYGDPKFSEVPMDDLLSPAYAASRAGLVGDTASLSLRPGSPSGRAPGLPSLPQWAVGQQPASIDGDTCHLDVVDRWGTVISATPSGGWFQGAPTIPSLGFSLTTRAQMFFLDDDLPNSLRPGQRPRTTLTPSMVLRDGEPIMGFGTPGGDGQDQWPLMFFLRYLHGGQPLQAAIDAPSFWGTSWPDSFFPRAAQPGRVMVESRWGEEVIADLRRRGHDVAVVDPWSASRITAVTRDPSTGELAAAADPRGMQCYAIGR